MTPDADPTALYEAKVFQATIEGQPFELPYRLMRPSLVEPAVRYPLVLFLHGAGERGDDNKLQLKYLPTWLASEQNRRQYPAFVVAPQCPAEMKWSNVDWSDNEPKPLPEISRPMQAVVGLLDEVVKREPVDPRRIYLTGLSMGGYGAWDLAMRRPERFAALVPICGGGDESQAGRLVGMPIWAWHGDADQAVPVERSRRMIAAIERAGGHPKYTELPGVGHDSWTPAYTRPDGVLPWLFAQAKPAAARR
jgi:predicted peptidase